MGKHFDSLVEAVRHNISDDEVGWEFDEHKGISKIQIKPYLESIAQRAKIFEFPFSSFDIRDRAGKVQSEYVDYINDYLKISASSNTHLITPFRVTAIEDKESVVILEKPKNELAGKYRLTLCGNIPTETEGKKIDNICIACADIRMPVRQTDLGVPIDMSFIYHFQICSGQRMPSFVDGEAAEIIHFLRSDIADELCAAAGKLSLSNSKSRLTHKDLLEIMGRDIAQSMTSYMGELVYIMDPENFIIQRESNASRKLAEKLKRKNGGCSRNLRKTVDRPHYIFLSADEVNEWILDNAKEPWPAHPVKGHWKTLVSEKYKKMRGQIIQIPQYWTGRAEFYGINGWHYRIMVKKSPTELAFYRSHEDCKSMPRKD